MNKMNKIYLSMLLIVLCETAVASRLRTVFDPRAFEMPEECKDEGQEFCFEKGDSYPTEIIEELLKNLTNLVVAPDGDVGEIGSYSDRQGDSSESDCSYHSKMDPIYYIEDQEGKDRVVVQLEGRFQQRYSVMWCDQDGAMTSRTEHFLESAVLDYKLSCQNRYVDYEFLVLSSDDSGKWTMERAKTKSGIPVCCVCRYDLV